MLKETPLPTTVRPRHYQKLSERLRQFMAENHFRDGDKLPPERALAESFGVSRNSVREAIHALEPSWRRHICQSAGHGTSQERHS